MQSPDQNKAKQGEEYTHSGEQDAFIRPPTPSELSFIENWMEKPPPLFKKEIISDTEEYGKQVDQGDKNKKAKIAPVHLGQADQEDIIEWFKSNPCLYDKGNADYKLTEMKDVLWDEKAQLVAGGNYSGSRLKTWLISLRSQYGKLSKHPRGSRGRLSDRDKWILEKFDFLSAHIYRVPKRKGVDLMAKHMEKERHFQQAQDSQSDVDESLHENRTESVRSPTSSEDLCASIERQKRKRCSSEQRDHLEKRIQEPSSLMMEERYRWGQWISSALPCIHDSLWGEFQAASLQLVESFRQRSRLLERQEQQ